MFEFCCQKLDRIARTGIPCYVLINEPELLAIAKKYPAVAIVPRAPETGMVDGPLQFIFKDMLTASSESHLMFLNPCLIFLRERTIIDAVHRFNASASDYATSVKKFQNWIMGPNYEMLCPIDYRRLSTKEIEPMYEFANAFHIFNRMNFMEDGCELKPGFEPVLIDSAEECIDIDTESDYLYAKWYYENVYARRGGKEAV